MERDARNRDKLAERLATLSPAKRALLERRRRGDAAGAQVSTIEPRPGAGPAPLSFSQRRMWFLDQFEPGSPTYNLRVLLRLSGALDRASLARAFQEVVRRHEVLRTAFRQEPGASEPVQVILPALDLPLPLIDLSALPADRREAESLRRTRQIATSSFDLTRPPLVRVALLALQAEGHHLVVAMHHIVSDGWSMGVMVQEIGALYAAFQAGADHVSQGRDRAPSPLPALPIQYADFAVWQREHLTGEVLERDLGYWREHLAGAAAALDLPTDRVRPAVPSSRGAAWRFAFEPALMEGVEALARREGATTFMVLAAGLFALLSRLSGQRDLTLGSPVAGRNRPEIEGLIGFFVNTLVFRADTGRSRDFRGLLEQVREAALGAFGHQEVPFERLVAELAPDDRDTSRTPLFQVALALQNAPLQDASLAGLRLHPEQMPVDNAKFDLAFIVGGESGPLAATLEYATDLFDRATAARLCGQWLRLLERGTAAPESELAALELLSPAERQQLLLEWNDTEAPAAIPGHTLLHEPFETQVDQRPEALAAVWEGESVTYRELEARANQLASFLRSLGAGPGAPVGVWMDRSLDMLVALLGSCKAGAAYLPIDASWPAERAEAVLAGTQAHFVLTRTDHLAAVQGLQWRLPSLGDAICLDVATPELPVESLDVQATQELWDVIAERATDWVTAGGFYSAYTGEPFAEAEVLEYRDRVLGLAEPWLGADSSGKRVLEIGNGSGLILWELAPRVARYVGIDPSERTQERNRERAARDGAANVELLTGFAHEIEALPAGSFDLVILASTVQFFPGLVYLERVLDLALSRLAPGGAVVVADVMDPRRREDFRRSLAEYAAAHPGSAAGRHREARELMVDEGFFADFPGTQDARLLHREQGFPNELRFRYDVVLRKEEAAASSPRSSPRPRSKRVWTGWHVGQAPAERPTTPVSAVDIAYVIHTSGSTGEPKGIVVQHRPAVELCRWISTRFGVGPDDRLLFITSPAFDLSVYDVFGVLGAGGTVHVAPEGALRDPERMVRLLTDEPVTIWDSAPAALQQLAPLLPEPGSEAGRRAALRLVMLSGDWIPVKLPDVVRASYPGARVMSLGGATEATVWSNFFPVEEVDPRWPSIPYGRPIANAQYHVLDAALQPCPIGIPGDLYIGGDCLCVGYARLPAMTAERFIPDPFSGEPGERLYSTGDRARYLVDGNLEFLGRVDQQVKVRGYRIELEEIEAVLVRQPGVREAAVVVREDVPGDKRLVGYVVPAVDPAPTAAELRAALGLVMPEYMVPWTFVTLDRMPVTANGKLDRKGLPAPLEAEEDQVEYVAPETEMEHAIAGIWSEVLGRPRIGLDDNFFELGGSSLVAAQVIARVRQLFAVELPLRALFENRTLGALAARVDTLRAAASQEGAETAPPPPLTPELRPEPRPEAIPLSFAQQRLWLVDQLGPGSALYNIPGAVRLSGALDPALLGRVLDEIVRRHEVLRTTFASVDGQPVQVISASGSLPLPVVDLSALPADARETEAARQATAEARLPFDLARGPLLRAALLRLGAEEHVVLVTFHHIVSDAWSVEVFFREVAALFRALSEGKSAGEPSPLPELPVQYADFALWQRRRLTGEVLDRELEHWKQRLAGAPRILELPTDRPRPAFQSLRGATRRVHLSAALLEPLASLGRQTGTTPFMNVLAAYATLLGRHAGQEDVLVGSPIAGRGPRETEGLIGFFVNTLVLRTDLSGDPTFGALLDRVRATALDAYAHQEVPFERLVDALVPVRDPSHSPLFQVVLALQDAPAEALRLPGLEVAPVPVQSGTAKVDLLLSLIDHQGSLSGLWEYNTDLFDASTIDRLTGQLETLLAAVGRNLSTKTHQPVSELPLLTEPERHQLWTEWNDTRVPPPLPDGLRLDQLFTASVARWPERVALRFGRTEVTYGELAERAEALARHLRGLGVGPDVRVGICAEEGIGRIVGVVATLLAGGAYVPLDPAHPGERLGWMLHDSGVQVLLTEENLLTWLSHHESAVEQPVVCLDKPLPEAGGVELSPAARASASPDNLAYIIYTSGSTGRPNGVMVSHRTAVHLIGLAAEHTRADETSRVLQLVSFSFDASVLETWLALSVGGTLCIVDRETRMSGPALAEAIKREGITQMAVPPPILTTIPHEGITSLRTILVGGDRCPADLANRWVTLGPHFRILNCYGPTETTIYAGFHRCVGPYRRDPSIGRPIANLRMMVLDPRGNPVPVGVPGELWVGGAQTARGYWNRPALTAQRLVPDPTAEEPGARAYRSGDLVRLLPDGEIEFLGRIDRQVKLRGLRIELGEIEATLAEHPGVRECTVMVREDTPGESLLAAYLVPAGEAAPEPRELRDFLAGKLPSYMIPGVFVALDAMPLSPTGKVDRKALPVPAETRIARESVAPRNPVEQTLAEIWRQVLNRETVGVYDNFFELGGDSILGIQVVSRAQQAGLGLTARDLFQHQTVAELAELATAAAAAQASAEIPLTAGQRNLLDRVGEAGLAQSFDVRRFALRDTVDPAHLEQALRQVAERHEALRVRFVREEGNWRQLPSTAPVTLEESEAPLRAGFALASDELGGPLLRAALVEAPDWTQRLVLAVHRLAADRASWRLLLADLETAVRGEEIPPVPVSVRQWSARPAATARPPFPADAWTGAPYALAVDLDTEATRSLLEEVGPAFRTRVEEAVLTALVEAFGNRSGEHRLRVDVETDVRVELPDGLDASRTVGRLATATPLLLALNRSQGPGERLKAVKEQLRAPAPSDPAPAVQEPAGVLFRSLEPAAGSAPEPALFVPLPEEPAESATGHPLEITAEVVDGQLRLTWSFDEGRHDESTIQQLADSTLASLRSLIEHCRTGEGGGFTASDFPEARFSQKDLNALMSQLGKRKAGPAGSK